MHWKFEQTPCRNKKDIEFPKASRRKKIILTNTIIENLNKYMNKLKWKFIPFKARDMYTATSAEVSICISRPSVATYEYKSPNFNEVFAVYTFTQYVGIKCIV